MYDEKVMLIPTSWAEDFADVPPESFGRCLRATMANYFRGIEPQGLSNFEFMVYKAMKADVEVTALKAGDIDG